MGGNFPGGNCPGGSYPGWEFSGRELSWVETFFGGNFPGGNCPVGIIQAAIFRVGVFMLSINGPFLNQNDIKTFEYSIH